MYIHDGKPLCFYSGLRIYEQCFENPYDRMLDLVILKNTECRSPFDGFQAKSIVYANTTQNKYAYYAT